MNSLGVDRENPYAEPKAPLTGSPGAPARKTGFTRLQGLTIIVLATLLFLGARWYSHRAMIAHARAAALRAFSEREAREKNARKPTVASEPASAR